ncbi:hypothetical protein [Saccharothrix sp. HUAS TT1]|uniref:hypothetical protein n=1 Tax=unclassified Saccharothrix TaxID=2593673 RepID=UPI00345BF284
MTTTTVSTAELLRAHLDEQERVGWHLDWPEALATLRVVVDLHAPKRGVGDDDAEVAYCPSCLDDHGDYQEAPCATERALVQELLLRPYATWLHTKLGVRADESDVVRLASTWADVDWSITPTEAQAVLTLVTAVTP